MKNFLVIGMGEFGKHIAEELDKLGNDVFIIDKEKAIIDELSDRFHDSYIGDCTRAGVLKELGVKSFDACIVAIGENFQSSLEITAQLKETGAKYIVAKASSEIQCKFLVMAGADETVYPQRDLASKLAIKYNADNVFDFIDLGGKYSIYEIAVKYWKGKIIQELDVRNKYKINIIAVKKASGTMLMPTAQYEFESGDHVVVIGEKKDVEKAARRV
ncbi:MAG: TrkA family potassium uptake protein [Clostridia bacterium]|nr:TrkA family potassium uptake protein [Clostridia bacterium]